MKRIIIHVGVHKTGSTAIQNFLFLNRKKLVEGSIYYPEVGLAGPAHHGLAYLFLPVAAHRFDFIDRGESAEKIFTGLLDDFEKSGCDTLLLSSEAFHEYIDIAKLKSVLSDYDVKILVYLRRQNDWLLSAYAQRVKQFESRFSGSFYVFPPYRTKRQIIDYRLRLKEWEECFGRKSIIVRVYEKSQMKNGLFSDFCTSIGIALDKSYALPPKDPNPSLCRDGVEVVRFFNNLELTRQTHNLIVNYVLKNITSKNHKNNSPLISPSEQFEIIDYYGASNAFVARQYLGRENGQLFSDPLPDLTRTWRPPVGLSKEARQQLMPLLLTLFSDRDGSKTPLASVPVG